MWCAAACMAVPAQSARFLLRSMCMGCDAPLSLYALVDTFMPRAPHSKVRLQSFLYFLQVSMQGLR